MSTEIFDPVTQRAEWLAQRRTYIGATDAGAILGENPYMTPHDVWLDKHNRLVVEETLPMWLGIELEPIIARRFEMDYGIPVRKSRLYRHPKFPHCASNPDREITWQGMDGLLECKSVGHWTASAFGPDGSDAIPAHYLTQCLWQLLTSGKKFVCLAALVDNRELKTYYYTLDPALSGIQPNIHVFPHDTAKLAFSLVCQWWDRHIVKGEEPEMTGRASDFEWLQKERPTYDNGGRSNAPESIDFLCKRLQTVMVRSERAELAEGEHKNRIKKYMAEEQLSILDSSVGPFTWSTDKNGKASFRTPFKKKG